MNVALIQLDGKLPNLALMKIAAHHRVLGDSVTLKRYVEWNYDRFDRVYASAIFEKTRPLADRLRHICPAAIIGGTGVTLDLELPDVGITTQECDYSLWPEFRSSLGYTQRGCRLKCSFCVVPRKEGKPTLASSIQGIWRGDPWPKELFLLDNDFFGIPQWRDRINEIRDGGFKVSFNQGVNVRLMTEEQAEAVSSVDYRDGKMQDRRFYTAWDNRKDEKILFRGLEWLCKYGMKPDHLMVYVLLGYCHKHEAAASKCNCPEADNAANREYRRAQLRAFGARPYPMPFERTRELVGFQRWILGAYDKRVSWVDFEASGYEPRNLRIA